MILPFVLLALSASAQLNAALSCPEWIHTKQSLELRPAGWEEISSAGPNGNFGELSGFSWGKDVLKELRPDSYWTSPKDKRITSATWRFDPGKQYWAVCSYYDTTIRLTQVLPKGLTECTIKTSGPQMHVSTSCKWSSKQK
jgi:hypothetical protein